MLHSCDIVGIDERVITESSGIVLRGMPQAVEYAWKPEQILVLISQDLDGVGLRIIQVFRDGLPPAHRRRGTPREEHMAKLPVELAPDLSRRVTKIKYATRTC